MPILPALPLYSEYLQTLQTEKHCPKPHALALSLMSFGSCLGSIRKFDLQVEKLLVLVFKYDFDQVEHVRVFAIHS